MSDAPHVSVAAGQVERAALCTDLDVDSLSPSRFDRVYFGGVTCELLIPTRAQVEGARAAARNRGLAFSLVSPWVTDQGLPRFLAALAALPPGDEVIVNDWGILRRLRAERPDLVPVAGFLLMREPRDPRATDDAGCPPLGRSAPDFRLSVPYLDLLRRHGLRRIEISAPHRGFTVAPLPPDFRLTLHAPYSFLAATRQCPWRAALARASLGTAGCPQPCRRRAARLNDPSHPHASFMLRWNAWYTLPPAADLAAIGADRLVLQVRPDGEACP